MNSSFWLRSTKLWFGDGASGSGGVTAPSPTSPGGSAPASAPSPGLGAGAPGPTPVPSSLPAEGLPAEGAEDGQGSDPFGGMEDDLDFVDLGDGGSPTETPSGEQPTPQAPPTAKGEPKPAAAQAPPQPAAPPAVAGGAQDGNAASAPRSSLEQAVEGFRAQHSAMSEWASQNLFALSKEEAEALETDAVAQIPKLMGKVYSQTLQAIGSLIQNFVPEMINQGVATQQKASARATEALNEFYTSHPHLNHAAHGAAVDKWARAFRAANPKASRSDAIAFVGRAVSAEVGVAPGSQVAKRPAPFAPARPGGRAPTSQKGENDPYAGMEDEYD